MRQKTKKGSSGASRRAKKSAAGPVRRTSQAFSTRHRIIDVAGKVHDVVVVGDRIYDDDGAVIGTHGFYVDVTPSVRQAQELVTEAVSEIAESRGAIEQAKGMLMLIYGLSGDAAFDLLRWRSQETNVKLRLLAEQIIADFMTVRDEGDAGAALPAREAYDALLLTAHLRVQA